MDLRDLIDLSFLQEFQDNFAMCVGVASLTEDAQGNALTQPSCFTDFCNLLRTTEIGLSRCHQCEIRGGEMAARTGKPAVYQCHAGLVDFAAPIMLEGKQIGAIFGGQILTDPPDKKKFGKIARKIGFDVDKCMAAVDKIPVMPEKNVQLAANALLSVANTFSKLAYQKLKLQKWNRELVLANNRLNNIFKTMSDGVLIIDNQGMVKQVNKVVEEIFGKPGSELVNRSIRELVGGKALCAEKLLSRQESYTDIEVLVDSSVGRIHCLSSGTPIKDDQGIVSGGAILLRPIEKIQKLINRFSGAQASFRFDDIIGESPVLLKTIRMASLAAAGKSNILLEGESGTGKEVFAQAIHNQSSRSRGPFVAVNCGAIPRELIASELFGYAEGAFTGAKRGGRPGKFELSSGGTLFLDEIGDMPLDQQVALLRVLQERSVTRIGDDKVIPVDVRIICATNKDLAQEVEKGNFRQDLYYRLNVVSLKIPALRQRREDIPLLFNHMLKSIGYEWRSRVKYVEPEVMDLLVNYDWPGNVRELQNVVERIVSITDGDTIRLEHLPDSIVPHHEGSADEFPQYLPFEVQGYPLRGKRKLQYQRRESQRIVSLLDECGGNISQVAREMGISRSTLYRKMQQYNIGN
ncbi:MAG: sigma 54-interacting transcriptional regulator [Syntrophomonadaceae bacterium]